MRSLLPVYSGVEYLVIVGDDRIVPFARVTDRTILLPEQTYAAGGDLTPTGTTVAQALAANRYLSDDPLAVLDAVSPDDLTGNLFLPDLAVGRLVETPAEITTFATFIGQDGVLDLSALDPSSGHKVLVTGYDFLSTRRGRSGSAGRPLSADPTPDDSIAPVDGASSAAPGVSATSRSASRPARPPRGQRGHALRRLELSGHATHYEEGVPGTDPHDIQGLSTPDIYGADACTTASPAWLSTAVSSSPSAATEGFPSPAPARRTPTTRSTCRRPCSPAACWPTSRTPATAGG